ncbi:MAG: threonine--tRNA ligase [Bdellovibrionaceae bacterium]|nr:threonine--tRNA ligase [Pseudobdellovibrionaceae bacterium]
MSVVRVQLPDKSVKEFSIPPTILQVAESIGPGLAKNCVGGIINGDKEIRDLRSILNDGDHLEIVTANSEKGRDVLRHTGAHILAQAVQELFKNVKVTIGPVVEEGFYYDFDTETPLTLEDLEKIETRMGEIIKRDLQLTREVWSSEKAVQVFSEMGETYKVEIIRDLGAKEVSIYKQGDWFDLCRGPHTQSTGQVKAVKVLSIAGAYWRGDQKNKQLQRVYATAFYDKKELKEHLHNLEEAKKRDHRKVGRELGLIMFHDWAPGMPFFTPKGTIIYNELAGYIRELYRKYGYQEVITPQIYDAELYKTSGHYAHYKDNMYFSHIGENKTEVGVKPMNCPGHCLLFGSEHHSYRELPYRIADFGRLHRYEASGALHGLTRVRSMSQDDAHIFCTENQLQPEMESFMTFLAEVYRTLGMDEYKVLIATRPEARMGSDETWDKAEGALFGAMEKLGIPYEVSPGDGAFYGPKIEVHFVDVMKRTWQLGTVQVDYNMPQSFHLKYVGDDNAEHTPIMLHRAILGTLERFIGIYIEHCAGRFPLWLAPEQVVILNVTDRQDAYCQELKNILVKEGVRVRYDNRNEKLGYKIREAQLQQVPYMLIIGDKEMEQKTVSVRLRSGTMLNFMETNEFRKKLLDEYKTKSLVSLFDDNKNTSANEGD